MHAFLPEVVGWGWRTKEFRLGLDQILSLGDHTLGFSRLSSLPSRSPGQGGLVTSVELMETRGNKAQEHIVMPHSSNYQDGCPSCCRDSSSESPGLFPLPFTLSLGRQQRLTLFNSTDRLDGCACPRSPSVSPRKFDSRLKHWERQNAA